MAFLMKWFHCSCLSLLIETLPVAVQSSIDILQRCSHHLSSPDPKVQLCVLECVHLCLCSLQRRQSMLIACIYCSVMLVIVAL